MPLVRLEQGTKPVVYSGHFTSGIRVTCVLDRVGMEPGVVTRE